MKTIGLIGGMSWASTVEYYRILNQMAKERLGGLHSAKVILYSVDFAEIEPTMREDRWGDAAIMLANAARSLHAAGADLLLLGTNSFHKVADHIERATPLPFLHIADACGQAIVARKLKKIALLGTRFTMEQDILHSRLQQKFGLEVIVPEAAERDTVHRIIFEELIFNKILPESKAAYLEVIDSLQKRGAEGVILGCTEIGLLIQQADLALPVFDTTPIHCQAAMDMALSGDTLAAQASRR
jgi:amino-acid racemase